jgi:hypothetical protein
MMKNVIFKWCVSLGIVSVLGLSTGGALAAPADIKSCLRQALSKDHPLYQVPEFEGKEGFSRYLVLICNGAAAKELYSAIRDNASPGEWSGKTRGEVKFFGEEGGSSACYHITRNQEGDPVSDYNCSIRLNIASQLLGKTQTGEMTPFKVKE